jgi:hypothetical protein
VPHITRRHSQHGRPHLQVGSFVRVAGDPVSWRAETAKDPKNVDHFWIDIRIDNQRLLQLSLSTYSRNNAAAGFDADIRLATVESKWSELPKPGIFSTAGLDYTDLAMDGASFRSHDRLALERLLTNRCQHAILIEAWGEYYVRGRPGVHQIHSRRASLSVAKDIIGRDGAIRFYFDENRSTELLLFKYAGQL